MASLLQRRERQYRLMVEASRQAAAARLAEIAESDEKKLAAADAARERGEMWLAATIYLRMAVSRTGNEFTAQARQRFVELRTEGQDELAAIDALLEKRNDKSASDSAAHYNETVQKAFQRYDELARRYGDAPGVGRKIRDHVGRIRRTPEFAAVLEEPEASELWRLGQQQETDGQVCCAYWTYEEAAKFKHAPSGGFASDRLAALRRNPAIVAAAKACSELQWCHSAFSRADKLRGRQAREMYLEIVRRAPEDSPVHLAAKAKLAQF